MAEAEPDRRLCHGRRPARSRSHDEHGRPPVMGSWVGWGATAGKTTPTEPSNWTGPGAEPRQPVYVPGGQTIAQYCARNEDALHNIVTIFDPYCWQHSNA